MKPAATADSDPRHQLVCTAAVIARELSAVVDLLTDYVPDTFCASIRPELKEYIRLLRLDAYLSIRQRRQMYELGELILLALRVDGEALRLERAKWDVDERNRWPVPSGRSRLIQ
jgi:hypothetical protein